jgi:hypothetical protein
LIGFAANLLKRFSDDNGFQLKDRGSDWKKRTGMGGAQH